MRRLLLAIAISTAVLLAVLPAAAAGQPETADVMTQDGMGVHASDGARLVRQANGIAMSVTMPTPEPGSYVYADGTESGHPEVFTLWAFVFSHPENCSDACGPDDVADPAVGFGVYNVAGHVNAGATLNLSGRVGVGEPAMGPPGAAITPLSNPAGAEVHLAVAPHGALDPATLPSELRVPVGSPVCGCWWVALFIT